MTSGIHHVVFLSQYLWDRFLKEGFLKAKGKCVYNFARSQGYSYTHINFAKKNKNFKYIFITEKEKTV